MVLLSVRADVVAGEGWSWGRSDVTVVVADFPDGKVNHSVSFW